MTAPRGRASGAYRIVRNNRRKDDMNDYKKQATLWYEAFSKNDPTILDRVLSKDWVDIPSAPDQTPGPEAVKPLLTSLKTTFPDLNLTIKDILQDGNKVVGNCLA